MIQVQIPLRALSVNKAFQGRRFKTPECNAYCQDFVRIAPRREIIKGIVEIEYRFFVKNHKLADWDNLVKITQDLLVKKNLGYIEDDRKIYKATVYKIPVKKECDEKIEIKILKLDLKI